MNKHAIAIDGPSGAGKSTLAKQLAETLGYLYVDTGAIYRTVGIAARKNGVDPHDAAGVSALLPDLNITMGHDKAGLQRMYLGGEDVTDTIREPDISMYASAVSAIPAVRDFLLELQRDLARTQNVIMDGRDIGTVVLPDAQLKIFLTADAEARASRRWKELQERGTDTTYEQVLAEMIQRDHNDMTRATAPLRQAEDAIAVDTTYYNLEESLQLLLDLVKERFH